MVSSRTIWIPVILSCGKAEVLTKRIIKNREKVALLDSGFRADIVSGRVSSQEKRSRLREP